MNPWESIALEDYETHMRSASVFQLQTLNMIMADQMSYRPWTVAVLGSAGGNGFEHLDLANEIFAVDINREYLRCCRETYSNFGDKLKTICCDLNESVLPPCDLLICNLIIEYLGIAAFKRLLGRLEFKTVSCVIQRNCGNNFVSSSQTAEKLASLNLLHRDIDAEELTECLGMNVIVRKAYSLPNNKQFIRIDFSR